jgi:cell wall assembly regulator SMI1
VTVGARKKAKAQGKRASVKKKARSRRGGTAQPLERVWIEYRTCLSERAPAAFANLARGASEDALVELAAQIQQPVPAELKALLRLNNGQRDRNGCTVFPGLEFLSTDGIVDEWLAWDEFRVGETPEGLESLDDYSRALDPAVRDVYTHPGWIPLLKDGDRSDYVGLDVAPAKGGVSGQVINFGRDEDQHFVAFPSLAGLVEFWLAEIRSGTCKQLPPDPPDYPEVRFQHARNGIDVIRSYCSKRRGVE